MSEPRTAAGRAWLGHSCDDGIDEQLDHILAIEAEAGAIDVERLARALPDWAVEHPIASEDELRVAIATYIAAEYDKLGEAMG